MLKMPTAMTAGAVISGAYMGDKMSPLSETTVLVPRLVGGVTVNQHIRGMLWTVGPSFVAAVGSSLAWGSRKSLPRRSIPPIYKSVATGHVAHSSNETINALFSRGGMTSMLTTVWLILGAMGLPQSWNTPVSLTGCSDPWLPGRGPTAA